MREFRQGHEAGEGAAAVEMAILLPVLMLLLGGIIDFGFMLNAQISLTHAAREGVRVEAIGATPPPTPVAAATAAFTAPAVTGFTAAVTRACPVANGAQVTTSATYTPFLLPIGARNLTSQAVMRCNG
ncbi:TadE/TadG family type IV pilus assembly protein [Egicoccus sp. AB-alg6-2]|uniref:TadE/TadG family type IV pilus assembly protein n=1 Tax=Egicoccus sp. AB-alg6-2 TaxID=3242692 RepID=UPI00359DCE8D